MGLLGDFFESVIDKAADTVQTLTGEKERRKLVQDIKETYSQFRLKVEDKIDLINDYIDSFNMSIRELNTMRRGQVRENICILGSFLGKFGKTKEIGEYTSEKENTEIAIPEQEFQRKEDYIKEIDWSKEDVFEDTFFLTPIGMAVKTREQNQSMYEQMKKIEHESIIILQQLELKEYTVMQDKEIADLYIHCVSIISEYIRNTILPELQIVETFFQSIAIKNKVIAEDGFNDVKYNFNLSMINDNIYSSHYQFIKNSFMFYVISCKIYNTSVLTNLLIGNVNEEDKKIITEQRNLLLEQKQKVDTFLTFERG